MRLVIKLTTADLILNYGLVEMQMTTIDKEWIGNMHRLWLIEIKLNVTMELDILSYSDYFNSAHFSVIIPLHSMLLGTPKYMISIWKEKG